MPNVGTLTVVIEGETGKLQSALKRAGARVKSFDKNATDATKRLRKHSLAVSDLRAAYFALGAVIGSQVIGSLRSLVSEQLKVIDNIGKLSFRLGRSTEFLSEMAFAAQRSGVPFQQMTIAIQRAQRRLGQFNETGRGEIVPALQALGEEFVALASRGATFEQLLPKIADRLANMTDENKRLFIAQKLFDSEGVQFLNILDKGAAGLKEMTARARELGLTISQTEADAVQEFNDAWKDVEAAGTAAMRELTFELSNLAPEIKALADAVGPAFFLITEGNVLLQTFKRYAEAKDIFDQLNQTNEEAARREREKSAEINRTNAALAEAIRLAGELAGLPFEQNTNPLGLPPGGDFKSQVLPELSFDFPQTGDRSPVDLSDATFHFNRNAEAAENWARTVEDASSQVTTAMRSVGQIAQQALADSVTDALFQTGDAMQSLENVSRRVVSALIGHIIQYTTSVILGQASQAAATQTAAAAKVQADTTSAATAAAESSVRSFGILGIALAAGFVASAIAAVLAARDKAKSSAGTDFAFGGIAMSEIRSANIAEATRSRPEVIAPLRDLLPMIQQAVGNRSPRIFVDGQELAAAIMPHFVNEARRSGVNVV